MNKGILIFLLFSPTLLMAPSNNKVMKGFLSSFVDAILESPKITIKI